MFRNTLSYLTRRDRGLIGVFKSLYKIGLK
nr:MAG TPA: hypothetical protein [Caudoviricetes sp.]